MPDSSALWQKPACRNTHETATFSKSNRQQTVGVSFAKETARANCNFSLAPTERLSGWFV